MCYRHLNDLLLVVHRIVAPIQAQREDDEKAAAIIGEIMAAKAPKMGQVVNL